MAMTILDSCINCGSCEPDCPNDAISAGESIYVVDSALCTECVGHAVQPTCVQMCPVDGTILVDLNNVESPEVLLQKYQRIHASA